MRAEGWLGLITGLLVGCAGKAESSSARGDGASATSACEPLAANTTSVELAASKIVAAGEAKDGSVFVIYSDNRLFVGSSEALVERTVIGSGQNGDQTDLDYTDDDGTQVVVEAVRDADGTRMTVARGKQTGKVIDDGKGEQLTLLDAALVAAWGASTTWSFAIDFAASLDDGRELVVIAPVRAGGYDQFRVFFGPPSALAQRAVANFGSSKSSQRFASVTIDGTSSDLTYLAGGPSELDPAGGPSTLTIAGTSYELTEGPVPANARYLCLAP